jgi:hypothetical protein
MEAACCSDTLLHFYRTTYTLISGQCPVNCWFSPAQSFFVWCPVENYEIIFVRSNSVYVLGNGVSSSTRGVAALAAGISDRLYYIMKVTTLLHRKRSERDAGTP